MPVRLDLLLAGRLWRESGPLHHDAPVADHVLPPHVRDHSVDVAGHAAPWQVPPVHHVPRRPLRSHHHRHLERPLPQAVHTQNGAVGQAILHTETAQVAPHASSQSGPAAERLFFFFRCRCSHRRRRPQRGILFNFRIKKRR